ncbi:hscB mitochondrial iron-sulfur cluster co-chaperone L homeolog isoform X1 [Xenopus laevis]|uniref:HscB mitochondrial iron-sulfur cluster co-chaperone L homeolog isoform X1 n=1 Tax=Xenopus laevis TaxID=8355 RepID=A0A8J0UBL0_XENLA|nr:hscB mitochondrial iron-sulfur cluster co-chaperone L homeolog isoform X1 [Xenopus laevis]
MEPTRALFNSCSSQWMRMVVQRWWKRPVIRGFWEYSWPRRLPCMKSAVSHSTLRPNFTYSIRTYCATTQSRLCWSCQAQLSRADLFCPACTTLQPPDESKDFFQVLDCEKSFNVNTRELQRKYRNLQRLLHPDFFSQKSELSLNGITLKDGADDEVDTQFLFDILELNEQLNDADAKADIEEVGDFVQGQLASLTKDLRKAFQQGDLQEAKILLAKMKYFSNIQDQVKKKIIS